jgi:RNA recognition motif-containing protein
MFRERDDIFTTDSFSSAFHSQLHYPTQSHPQRLQNVPPFEQRTFDMGTLAGALPQGNQFSMNQGSSFGMGEPFTMSSGFHGHQLPQQYIGRGMPIDASAPPRAQQHQQQQQQYLAPKFSSIPQQNSMMSRQPMQMPPQGQYAQFDPFAYGINPMQAAGLDPRMASSNAYVMPTAMQNDFARRASEPAPIPSYPRGPPRKPKQSGHALWVGNLPPNANVTDLKDHFSRDATKDIESLFLISKSNCAFVNYRTEAACVAAMSRFHDSRFHGVRLVCRLRRGSNVPSPVAEPAAETSETPSSNDSPANPATPALGEEPTSPTIVGSSQESLATPVLDTVAVSDGVAHRRSERFFIVKSLTAQDLEASVRNGIWATQSHNEKSLNEAYDNADHVYLIFSANKSGEYFGYARMASTISGEPVNLSSIFSQSEAISPGTPQSIPTTATATAPRGRIIDDSGRGTIFWEAEHSDNDEEGSPDKGENERTGNQNWGRQFSIEWISTARLPFYRTRGLRNPWK